MWLSTTLKVLTQKNCCEELWRKCGPLIYSPPRQIRVTAAILDFVGSLGVGQQCSLLSGSDNWRGANKSIRGRRNDTTWSATSTLSTSALQRCNCDKDLQKGIWAVLLLLISSDANGTLLGDVELLAEETHGTGCVGNTAFSSKRQKIHAVYHAKHSHTFNQQNSHRGENNKR